jgi:hypothetical protein
MELERPALSSHVIAAPFASSLAFCKNSLVCIVFTLNTTVLFGDTAATESSCS